MTQNERANSFSQESVVHLNLEGEEHKSLSTLVWRLQSSQNRMQMAWEVWQKLSMLNKKNHQKNRGCGLRSHLANTYSAALTCSMRQFYSKSQLGTCDQNKLLLGTCLRCQAIMTQTLSWIEGGASDMRIPHAPRRILMALKVIVLITCYKPITSMFRTCWWRVEMSSSNKKSLVAF